MPPARTACRASRCRNDTQASASFLPAGRTCEQIETDLVERHGRMQLAAVAGLVAGIAKHAAQAVRQDRLGILPGRAVVVQADAAGHYAGEHAETATACTRDCRNSAVEAGPAGREAIEGRALSQGGIPRCASMPGCRPRSVMISSTLALDGGAAGAEMRRRTGQNRWQHTSHVSSAPFQSSTSDSCSIKSFAIADDHRTISIQPGTDRPRAVIIRYRLSQEAATQLPRRPAASRCQPRWCRPRSRG